MFDVDGGFSSQVPIQRRGWSVVEPPGLHRYPETMRGSAGYGSTAMADAWAPPSTMALPEDICGHVVDFTRSLPPAPDGAGMATTRPGVTAWAIGVRREPGTNRFLQLERAITEQIDMDTITAVVDRFKAANAKWWTLELDAYTLIVKRYTEGGGHPTHMDWQPDLWSQSRKLAASIQLSGADDYAGGTVWVEDAGPKMLHIEGIWPVPRDRGSYAVFPSWTRHLVDPVTAGERWVLLVNGWGDRLR